MSTVSSLQCHMQLLYQCVMTINIAYTTAPTLIVNYVRLELAAQNIIILSIG